MVEKLSEGRRRFRDLKEETGVVDLKEIKDSLNTGLLGENIIEYDSGYGYIGDIITEIADNAIDIYITDLFEWAKYSYDYINDAIKEFGAGNDIIQLVQLGQFLQYENDMYENYEDIILYYALYYIIEHGTETLTEDEYNKLFTELKEINNNELLEKVIEVADKFIK